MNMKKTKKKMIKLLQNAITSYRNLVITDEDLANNIVQYTDFMDSNPELCTRENLKDYFNTVSSTFKTLKDDMKIHKKLYTSLVGYLANINEIGDTEIDILLKEIGNVEKTETSDKEEGDV